MWLGYEPKRPECKFGLLATNDNLHAAAVQPDKPPALLRDCVEFKTREIAAPPPAICSLTQAQSGNREIEALRQPRIAVHLQFSAEGRQVLHDDMNHDARTDSDLGEMRAAVPVRNTSFKRRPGCFQRKCF